MLEHNVSVESVVNHKLAALADAEILVGLVRDALPELSEDDAFRYTAGIWLMTAGLWAFSCPPEAVVQALATDERLAKAKLDFPVALADFLTTQAIGLNARA